MFTARHLELIREAVELRLDKEQVRRRIAKSRKEKNQHDAMVVELQGVLAALDEQPNDVDGVNEAYSMGEAYSMRKAFEE